MFAHFHIVPTKQAVHFRKVAVHKILYIRKYFGPYVPEVSQFSG